MADVGKVQGPSGQPENLNRKEKASPDADKFKQAMRRRVKEVSQVDPDEQKKRKRQEEAEEELEGPPPAPTPPTQVSPFSLEQEAKKVSPLEMQGDAQSVQAPKPTQSEPSSFYRAPSPAEMEDDSGVLEEESFIEDIPSKASSPPPTAQEGQIPTYQPPQPSSSQSSSLPTAPEQKQQPGQQPRSEPPHRAGQPTLPRKETPGMMPPPATRKEQGKKVTPPPQPKTEQAGTSSAELEGTLVKEKEDTSTFFEQMSKRTKRKEAEVQRRPNQPISEEELEAESQGALPPPPPSAITGGERGEEKKIKESEETSGLPQAQAMPEMQPQFPPAPTLETLPPYAHLDPQVMELFDRMAGVMTVMQTSGITETTITLNAPQFASSVFFGTQIIIQEFSTAPKAFNIQLNGTPQAVALFQGNADDLMAAFQAGNYNFRVNRLETGYLTERPLFKRKDQAGDNDKDQTGENPR
jgi:hypothetical protein